MSVNSTSRRLVNFSEQSSLTPINSQQAELAKVETLWEFNFAALLQRTELGVLLDGPVLALREVAVVADEHPGGLLVALQLPLEPGEGNDGELAAVRLAVGAAMTDGEVGGAGGHMADATEVVHTVANSHFISYTPYTSYT